MMREIVDNMEQFRARNHGRLFFLMKTDGTLLKMDENANPVPLDQVPGEANFSDLFYSKGLWAAAAVLDDKKLMKTAEKILIKNLRKFRLLLQIIFQTASTKGITSQ